MHVKDSRSFHLPNQRWHIYPILPSKIHQLAQATGLPPLLAQVLINRGIQTPAEAKLYLDPDSLLLPHPLEEFPDLALSIELLQEAIASTEAIAICGDYDADGMTSTALLLRALRYLGARVDYAIPSRMKEGYGINNRIVEEFHTQGVKLILTVDNGISAVEPVQRAREIGIKVIITDHHDIPPQLPPANAILNPKLISAASPYRGLAGVGIAYILAVTLAQQLGKEDGLYKTSLELFTLGTIADLAPLTGVNRRWLKRGLQHLSQSQLTGVQALIGVSGVNQQHSLRPEDIGFRLGPRINAVGRLADPQIAIELLTTTDKGIARERARQCEQLNKKRQEMCAQIEQEAIAWCAENQINCQQERVLVIVQPQWHHGVIGIVASRLVERYGVPVFLGTYETDSHLRGSARGIPEFHVFQALQYCDNLLGKYGGHQAAGGFSLRAEHLEAFQTRLREFAYRCLQPEHLRPLVKIDSPASFHQINLELYQQIDALHPCGIENSAPIFWTPNVRVFKQKIVGKSHLKLTLGQETGSGTKMETRIREAIAWRWGEYFPLPAQVDIAYKLRENNYNGNRSVELELIGVRLPSDS
ncbi:MAG: single-stranded-DNA-specific exonuclease RecJ [Hormoscilla sp. GM7CHS1pb]|nr:single-stranded-DNA-specific exonuclease RecJ [Hormoscilla sp. GM7CHS1pb]